MKPFYVRLKQYFEKVGKVLKGEAEAASIFPNTTDIGMSRERVYAEFLRQHLPSNCNVTFGGFVFDLQGKESKQIDLIVISDNCVRFNFHNPDGSGKAFASVEGCVGVVSLKSNLTTAELHDALDNIASLPDKLPIEGRIGSLLNVPGYQEWPFKIIYASSGVRMDTAGLAITEFYNSRPEIPHHKRPSLIHVAGQYSIVRLSQGGKTRGGDIIFPNTFHGMKDVSDVVGLCYAMTNLQSVGIGASHMLYDFNGMIDSMDIELQP